MKILKRKGNYLQNTQHNFLYIYSIKIENVLRNFCSTTCTYQALRRLVRRVGSDKS